MKQTPDERNFTASLRSSFSPSVYPAQFEWGGWGGGALFTRQFTLTSVNFIQSYVALNSILPAHRSPPSLGYSVYRVEDRTGCLTWPTNPARIKHISKTLLSMTRRIHIFRYTLHTSNTPNKRKVHIDKNKVFIYSNGCLKAYPQRIVGAFIMNK